MEPLSPGDLTVLATDRGQVPMHIAAVLTLGSAARLSPEDLAAVLTERLPQVPRLRQRLVRPRWGAGRSYCEDDPDLDLSHHVSFRRATDGQGLLDVAAELVCARLDDTRPLWSACVVAVWSPCGLVTRMHVRGQLAAGRDG